MTAGQSHICDLPQAQTALFMAHLGAGMATGLLQPLAVFGTLDHLVCLIIRVALPAARWRVVQHLQVVSQETVVQAMTEESTSVPYGGRHRGL